MSIRDIVPWRKRERAGELARRDMFEDTFMGLQQEMNRLFDSFFSDFGTGLARPAEMSWLPQLDVKETDETVEVTAELPGLDEKDLEVTLDDGSLILKGEKKAEKEEKVKGYHRVERTFGSFYRRVPIPTEVDEDKIEARFEKGVLNIKLPKTKAAKAKTVPVRTH